MKPQRVLGGVLVGGTSSRMGRPKQLIDVGGRTLVEGVVAALKPEVEDVILLGDGQVPSTLADFRRLPDADGCNGPMAAILSALTWASDACWVIAACDLPLIRSETIRWLLEQREPGTTAVYPRVNGYLEPLLAIYEPAARLHLEEASRKGRFSLQVLPKMADVVQNQPPSALDGCWSNANTPSDLAELASGSDDGLNSVETTR